MNKYIIFLFGLALIVLPAIVIAETDYVAMPVLQDIQKGVDNQNAIVDLRVKDDATIGDDADVVGDLTAGTITSDAAVTATTSVAAGTKVTSYGYPAVVGHTNGSAQVWMTQSGSVTGVAATTNLVTFPVSYIATPNVVCMPTVAAVVTNGATLTTQASNLFVVTCGEATNFNWIAHGRIK